MSNIGSDENKKIFINELKLLQKQGDNEFIVKYFDYFQPDTRFSNCSNIRFSIYRIFSSNLFQVLNFFNIKNKLIKKMYILI